MAFVELMQQRRNVLGLVLQIGIHGHHPFSSDVLHSHQQSLMLPNVCSHAKNRDVRVGAAQFAQRGKGVLGASVVDKQELEIETRDVKDLPEPAMKLGDERARAVDRKDDA